jgi:hypothetical protein
VCVCVCVYLCLCVCVCVCVCALVCVYRPHTLTLYVGLQTALLTALVLGLAFRTGIWVCDWAIRIGDAKEWWIPEAAERLGTCPFFPFFYENKNLCIPEATQRLGTQASQNARRCYAR